MAIRLDFRQFRRLVGPNLLVVEGANLVKVPPVRPVEIEYTQRVGDRWETVRHCITEDNFVQATVCGDGGIIAVYRGPFGREICVNMRIVPTVSWKWILNELGIEEPEPVEYSYENVPQEQISCEIDDFDDFRLLFRDLEEVDVEGGWVRGQVYTSEDTVGVRVFFTEEVAKERGMDSVVLTILRDRFLKGLILKDGTIWVQYIEEDADLEEMEADEEYYDSCIKEVKLKKKSAQHADFEKFYEQFDHDERVVVVWHGEWPHSTVYKSSNPELILRLENQERSPTGRCDYWNHFCYQYIRPENFIHAIILGGGRVWVKFWEVGDDQDEYDEEEHHDHRRELVMVIEKGRYE